MGAQLTLYKSSNLSKEERRDTMHAEDLLRCTDMAHESEASPEGCCET